MDALIRDEATTALRTLGDGDPDGARTLAPLVYEELRRLAGAYFGAQPVAHTMQPTALVHEAYLKLIDGSRAGWRDRAHFLAVAATAMRQVLVNHAHARAALKRGGDRARLPLDPAALPAADDRAEALVALDEAMDRLRELDPRKAQVVEMRFFGGMTMAQIAHVLGVSLTTVETDWRSARAWLGTRIGDADDDA